VLTELKRKTWRVYQRELGQKVERWRSMALWWICSLQGLHSSIRRAKGAKKKVASVKYKWVLLGCDLGGETEIQREERRQRREEEENKITKDHLY
jgi:hypothetical protein